jgi:L-2,4-diaminobutyrate decarboxylase
VIAVERSGMRQVTANGAGPAFLDGSVASVRAHASALALAARTVGDEVCGAGSPLAAVTPDVLERRLDISVAPELGAGLDATLRVVGERIVRNSVVVAHPLCAAHLHCPPLLSSLAAEAVISATNQSMDSWDQAPAATHLEERLIAWLGQLYGLGARADGVFTSGGTQSNLMGLLLARDRAAARAGFSIERDGITDAARRFRIVCSSTAHFSVRKAARILGLGDRSVVEVPADAAGGLDPDAVSAVMQSLADASLIPIALVTTAGTTDLGAIDPLEPLAEIAREHDAWLHVDAAVGGALALSDREGHRLAGIEAADSVTVDFHKLWFQPISCGAFLVRDRAWLEPALLHADYLNPEPDDDGEGLPNLVDKSLQTTRRFDALKLFVSMRTHGRRFFGRAVESTLDLAAEAARLVDAEPLLELARPVSLNTVVFRYSPYPPQGPERLDRTNEAIRSSLLHSGRAVIARTRLDGRVYLKLTLMNPEATPDDARELLALVVAAAQGSRSPELAAA